MLLGMQICGHIAWADISWEKIGLGLLFAVLGVIAVNLPYWKPKGPVIECQAVIKSKHIEPSNSPYGVGNRWNFLVIFVNEEEKEVVLYTNKLHFHELNAGDVGKLTYRGDTMMDFELQKWYESPIEIN